MWEILTTDEDFEKYVGTEVFVRFEVDPKQLTCCGNVKEFLQECANYGNNLKDGFYLLTKDGDDYHRFSIYLEECEEWSIRHNFIKEVYGIK